MKVVNMHAAKTNLSRLIEEACAGEEIIIARDAEPVVRLVPVRKAEARREFGALKGRLIIPDEFFEPLPADEIEAWQQ